MKKLLALLLTVSAMYPLSVYSAGYTDTWTSNGNYSTSWYNSSKTEFYISTAKDLAGLAYLVNVGQTTFKGKTIKIDADIDLTGKNWITIGNNSQAFEGSFDGQNHTITGVYIVKQTDDQRCYGFWAYLRESPSIKNIRLQGKINIENSNTLVNDNTFVGGLVGWVSGATYFENCKIDMDITCKRDHKYGYIILGGIIGHSIEKYASDKVVLRYCSHNGSLYAGEWSGPSNPPTVGGLVGGCSHFNSNVETIEYCENYSSEISCSQPSKEAGISSSSTDIKIGGLIGGSGCNVSYCRNIVDKINVKNNSKATVHFKIGGIGAANQTIKSCYSIIKECRVNTSTMVNNSGYTTLGGITVSKSIYSQTNYSNSDVSKYVSNNNVLTGYDGITSYSSSQMKTGGFLDELNLNKKIWEADESGYPCINKAHYFEESILVTKITLNASSTSLNVDDTKQLTSTITPSNATNKNVTWSSSNTSVATVSSSGLVTAKAAGSTTITCKAKDGSGVSATCTVTVNIPVKKITLNASSASLNTGGTKQLTATIEPSNATNKTVTWSSSSTSVATVSNSGLVTAKAGGTATITCKANDGSGVSATCTVTVNIPVKKITLNASSASLNTGGTKQLTATIEPSNATNKTVTWSSSSTSVATVSNSGLITAKAVGSATITCKANDGSEVSAECNVTVTDPVPIPDPITDISKLDNAIYTTSCSGMADSEVSLSINLKNKQSTCAYNFDIELPDGVSLATNDKGRYKYEKSSRHDDSHSVSINYNSTSGLYSFGVLSVSSEELTGNDGTILTVWLKIPASMKDGIYAIKIKNAKYSLVTGATSIPMPETASNLTIESYKKGDVNNDGMVDIADAVCIVNHIVGKSVPVFIEAAAHVNDDGVIDIADAVRIVNLVVGKISSLSRQTGNAPKSVVRKASVQNSIKANDIQFQSDSDTEASLGVNFQFDEEGVYSGYSFNIDLPSDFEFVMGKGTNVAYTKGDCHDESHSVTANLSEGLAKVACLSLSSEPLYGTAGKLLTFTIRPTKKLVTGSTYTGTIKDIIIVKENGEKKVLPSTTFTITISGQTIKGDVNGDSKVNGTDLVTLARMILGIDSKNNAADVNGDGKVNGTDYTALVNIIMGRSAGVRGTANEATALAAALQIEPFAISAGETKEVVISLTNKDAALTLLQFDMQLPRGLSVAQSEGSYLMAMSGRTNWDTHQLAAYGNAERMRFLLASGSNELIEGTDGAVIRLNMKATEDFEGGIITLNDILGVTPDEVEVWMPASNYTLNSNGTTGIYGIGTASGEPAIYGLSGQRQATLKKGVNIVDGKKVIKK